LPVFGFGDGLILSVFGFGESGRQSFSEKLLQG